MSVVLIVDDDSAIRRLHRKWLENWKFQVLEAGDATEALQRMSPKPADIVLCDIHMSGHDGFWLLEKIHQTWPQTAVIMASGDADLEIVMKAQRAGAIGFVTKPIGRETLRETLIRAVKTIAAKRNAPAPLSGTAKMETPDGL